MQHIIIVYYHKCAAMIGGALVRIHGAHLIFPRNDE